MKKMKIIGGTTIVDDSDVSLVESLPWRVSEKGYAICRIYEKDTKKLKTYRLHRLIAGTPKGMFTDHINRNRLDNRRDNLRVVTIKENNCNKSTKGYYYATDKMRNKPWRVRLRGYNKYFYTEDDAKEFVDFIKGDKE